MAKTKKINHLERLARALRDNPFASFVSGEEGNFVPGEFRDPWFEVSSPRRSENLATEFLFYSNRILKEFGIYGVEIRRSFSQLEGTRVLHKFRIEYLEKPFRLDRYEQLTRVVWQKIPRFVIDFYQKNRVAKN